MGVLLFKVVVYRLEELAVIARLHILRERHDPTAYHTQVLSVVDGQRIPIGQGLALHYSLVLLLLVCRNTILIQTQIVIQMGSRRVYLLVAEICISFAPVLIDGVYGLILDLVNPSVLSSASTSIPRRSSRYFSPNSTEKFFRSFPRRRRAGRASTYEKYRWYWESS